MINTLNTHPRPRHYTLFLKGLFRFLCQSYYRNSIGVVVAFSLLSRPSWAMVDAWVAEARFGP